MTKRLTVILFFFSTLSAFGQYQTTGTPPYGSFQRSGFDTVNLQNLNLNMAIPIVSSPGRGVDLNLSLVNDSLVWANGGGSWTPVVDQTGAATWGWKRDLPVGTATYRKFNARGDVWDGGGNCTFTQYDNYVYTDRAGTRHWFSGVFDITSPYQGCGLDTGTPVLTGYADDRSGYYIDITSPDSPKVYSSAGSSLILAGPMKDSNGNYVSSANVGNGEIDWTDSVGRTALKIITGTTSVQYKYMDTTGTYQTITLTLASSNIKTNFGCSGMVEYTGSTYLPTQLALPNGTHYTFAYEQTPSNSGYTTGRLSQVTLPNGGTYTYLYNDAGVTNDGINCSNGTTNYLKQTINDGTNSAIWIYNRTQISGSTVVTAPQMPYDSAANQTVYAFASGKESSRKVYQGSTTGTLLRTVTTTWDSGNNFPITSVTTLENNQQSKVATTYDSYGNVTKVQEYDWGSGAPGSLVRTTTRSYKTDSSYISANLLSLVTQEIVYTGDVTGTVKSRTDYAYDQNTITICPTGVPQHDYYGYSCSSNIRGNLTEITRYPDPVSLQNPIYKFFTYDVFGNVRTGTVNCCQQKQITFSSATQYAYPDSVTSGTSGGTQLTNSATYNSYTGLALTQTDENSQQASLAYDSMKRITGVTRADAAQVIYSYDDTNHKVTLTIPIQGSNALKQITANDGLGRPVTTTTQDSSSTTYFVVQTQYDQVGRPYKTSNPYTGSASYWTTTKFDALGRSTYTVLPDNSPTSYAYSGTTATVTDPSGKQRKTQSDGLGRLAYVYEPDVTNNNSLTQSTSYTYDVLNNLTAVAQGSQSRSYSYDGLSRLSSSTTPEVGQVSFQYNQYDLVTQRTDARNVVTNYAYDTLNRVVGVSYTIPPNSGVAAMPNTICNPVTGQGANSNVCYYYDQGGQSAYAVGRLTSMTDPSGSETYTYDRLGQVTQLQKGISGTTYTTSYAYNTAGELTTITYPSGRQAQESYDAIGRLSQVASGGTTYASGFGYNTAQQITGLSYGNGVAASLGYSSDRLQLTSIAYAKSGQNLFSQSYSYSQSGGNNGQVAGTTDSVQGGRSATYVYDPLARLTQAYTAGSTNYPKWDLTFSYDRYGNRTNQTVQSDTSTSLQPPAPSNSVTVSVTTNRITTSGYSYDASGNMTNDGLNTMTYDGESRVATAANTSASATYTYDNNRLRVKKAVQNGTTTVYIFSGSKVIAEYENGAAVGSPTREYIYSGGQMLAKIEGGAAKYYHKDQLSTRVVTDSSGNVVEQHGHYPFGEAWYDSGDKWKFTSYERDAETGNDYASARYYVNRLARFSSPDVSPGEIYDPQSMNRYSYVRNDPINFVDPSGNNLDDDDWGGGGGGWEGGDEGDSTFGDGGGYQGGDDSGGGGCDPNYCITVTGSPDPPGPTTVDASIPGFTDASQDAGFDPFAGSSGIPGGGDFTTGSLAPPPPSPPPAYAALLQLAALLRQDPDCLTFLGGAGIDVMGTINNLHQYGWLGEARIEPIANRNGSYQIRNAQTPGVAPGQAITLNTIGAFYNSSYNRMTLTTDRTRITGGTGEAQVFILLHELGHIANVLAPDADRQEDVNANDATLERNCQRTINGSR